MSGRSITFILSTIASSSAFSIVPTTFLSQHAGSKSKLPALIYGWDGGDDDEIHYTDIISDVGEGMCTSLGTAVADSLSHDESRTGNLARLAVAFSPPERQISLKDIQRIDVSCVREDQIEIDAMICEGDGGCVKLSVPIKFPRECGSDPQGLEVCVRENLDSLDLDAQWTLRTIETNSCNDELDVDGLFRLSPEASYPYWWIPAEYYAGLVADCDNICKLMNEDDYQHEIIALARDGLNHAGEAHRYEIQKARVSKVGPAGLYLQVAATCKYQEDLHLLDVMYPFGGEPTTDVESLRAAVLGAIVAAEERRPAQVDKQRYIVYPVNF